MPIIVDCPSCGRKLRLADEIVGRLVKCPDCQHRFSARAGGAAPPHEFVRPLDDTWDEDRRPRPLTGDADEPAAWEDGFEGRFLGVRRDCDPHRGGLVLTLGIVSIVFGVLTDVGSLFGSFAFCCPLCFSTSLVSLGVGLLGLPLGIVSWVAGQKDLSKMHRGEMDPEGQGATKGGWICGIVGTILCGLGLLLVAAQLVMGAAWFASAGAGVPPPVFPGAPVAPPPPPPPPPPEQPWEPDR